MRLRDIFAVTARQLSPILILRRRAAIVQIKQLTLHSSVKLHILFKCGIKIDSCTTARLDCLIDSAQREKNISRILFREMIFEFWQVSLV